MMSERRTLTTARRLELNMADSNRSLVNLRPVDESDVDNILSWVNDQTVVGNLAVFAGKPLTRVDELAWVRRMRTSTDDRVFTVTASDDGRYLGQVGLHQIFWRSKLGRAAAVISRKDEMGKGFGSAAIARLLDTAFDELGLHKVWLMVFAHNSRSLRTWERVGFQREGLLRDEYFHDGAWHDMVRLGMLSNEWTRP
jgi:RimJ/RimL family protein N-acetyltransferase